MDIVIVVIFIVVVVFLIAVFSPKPTEKGKRHIQLPHVSTIPRGSVSINLSFEVSETNIPKYFVFDIETTGLPLRYEAKASDTDNWPRVVQLSWMVLDADLKPIIHETHIIKPHRYRIPAEVSNIHGITHARAMGEGRTHNEVYPLFLEHLHGCDTVVCHNATFDVPVVEADLLRWKFGASIIGKKKVVCTMRSGTHFCAIPKPKGRGYKYPKLSELYFCLCAPKMKGAQIEGLHDASLDVMLTVKCLEGLNNWRIPLIEPAMKL